MFCEALEIAKNGFILQRVHWICFLPKGTKPKQREYQDKFNHFNYFFCVCVFFSVFLFNLN